MRRKEDWRKETAQKVVQPNWTASPAGKAGLFREYGIKADFLRFNRILKPVSSMASAVASPNQKRP